MFCDTYELTDLFDTQYQQSLLSVSDKSVELYNHEQTSESAFLGPIVWDDPLTLTDLESINLDDFSGHVLTDAIFKGSSIVQDDSGKRDRPIRRRSSVVSTPVESTVVKPSAATSRKKTTVPSELKNDVYWDRRRKNNESAKRSRDSRRLMETQVHMKAAELEKENEQLKSEVARLLSENERMRLLLAQQSIPLQCGQNGLASVSTLTPVGLKAPRQHTKSGDALLGV